MDDEIKVPQDLSIDIQDILDTIDGLTALDDSIFTEKKCKTANRSAEEILKDLEEQGLAEPQLNEVAMGLDEGLPVEVYAKQCYSWMQMREIRLGLLSGLDTEAFENPLYTVEQMREIRLGMVDRIDISKYAKLIVSATDMKAARHEMVGQAYLENPVGYGREIIDEDTELCIRISDDYLQAFIRIKEGNDRKFSAAQVEKILRQNEVTVGVKKDVIQHFVKNQPAGEELLVAQGEASRKGKDGWYDYRFDVSLPGAPRILPDGRADYSQVVIAQTVLPGQEIAVYHAAEAGKKGKTVTGIELAAPFGTDLPKLSGKGICKGNRPNVYLAALKGFVTCDPQMYSLSVWSTYVIEGNVNRYNGNVVFDGIVYVRGSVGDMVHIIASGDIVVDGFVESAFLEAGHDILIRGGVNAGGRGLIKAGGKVMANFYEEVSVQAGNTVEGNYFLNCQLETDGKVIARGGKSRIIGGKITAMVGVESATLGYYGNANTFLNVGDIASLDERLQKLCSQKDKSEDEIRQLESGKHKLRQMFGNTEAETNSIFHKICVALGQKEEEVAELGKKITMLENTRKRTLRAYIKILGEVDSNVSIRMNGQTVRYENGTRGLYLTSERVARMKKQQQKEKREKKHE